MILGLLAAIESEEERYAIEQIYCLYYDKMVAVAFHVLNDSDDAEDAAMDAIRYMCDKPQMFLEYENPKIYGLICLKVKCSAIDIFRTKKRIITMQTKLDVTKLLLQHDEENDVANILINEENEQILHKAIKELDDDHQIPIILKYFHGMRSAEIAEFMKININTVDTRIHRAKQTLKESCIRMGYQV